MATQAAPQIRSAVPTFLVPDVAGAARWYAEHLGFTLAGSVPKQEPFVYASLQRGGAELMLLSQPGYRKPKPSAPRQGGRWDAYIRVHGVRALHESVRGQAFVKMALQQQPYGDWEFEVVDPNGYVLVFGGD